MLFRGQVAHTRSGFADQRERHKYQEEEDDNDKTAAGTAKKKAEPEPNPEPPPPASPEEAAQPVVPLTGPASPKAP